MPEQAQRGSTHAREGLGPRIPAVSELHDSQPLLNEGLRQVPQPECDVVEDPQPRKQPMILKHQLHPVNGAVTGRPPNGHLSFVPVLQSRNDAQKRRLSRARWAEERVDFAGLTADIQASIKGASPFDATRCIE